MTFLHGLAPWLERGGVQQRCSKRQPTTFLQQKLYALFTQTHKGISGYDGGWKKANIGLQRAQDVANTEKVRIVV